MSEFRTSELLLIIFTAGPRPSQSDTYAVGRQGEVTELCLHLTFGQLFTLGKTQKKKEGINTIIYAHASV